MIMAKVKEDVAEVKEDVVIENTGDAVVDNESVLMCNLVASGMSVKEAREKVNNHDI
jgi:hypothetical protein